MPATALIAPALIITAQAFSLLLPITVAGITLILCMRKGWFAKLDVPLDAGIQFRGAPLVGRSKSVRGLMVYLIVATFVTCGLHFMSVTTDAIASVYKSNPLILGPLTTLGYLGGEVINSFVKRRIGIATSTHATNSVAARIQAIFDNVDGILASGLVLIFVYGVPAEVLASSFVMAVITHLSTDALMRKLHLKRKQQ